jgi:predicted nucleic acid-binding protein
MLVDQRDAANRWFRVLIAEIAELLPVDRSAFRRAATIITTAGVRVRAADALHLATAEAYGAKVCTLDKPQAEAAKACAIQTMLFASPP